MSEQHNVLGGDEDIPPDVRKNLMDAAVSNGRISYYWLCDVYRRGRLAAFTTEPPGQRLQLELTWSQLMALRSVIGEHILCPNAIKTYVDVTNEAETTLADLFVLVMQNPRLAEPQGGR